MNFELKDKDKFAPIVIASWICETIRHNQNSRDGDTVVSKAKIAKACRHLADVLDHQYINGCVTPD